MVRIRAEKTGFVRLEYGNRALAVISLAGDCGWVFQSGKYILRYCWIRAENICLKKRVLPHGAQETRDPLQGPERRHFLLEDIGPTRSVFAGNSALDEQQ